MIAKQTYFSWDTLIEKSEKSVAFTSSRCVASARITEPRQHMRTRGQKRTQSGDPRGPVGPHRRIHLHEACAALDPPPWRHGE